MAHPNERPIADSAEIQRRLDERRRRLERIAQRYQQLEEALESLEAMLHHYTARSEAEPQSPNDHRPRKPR